MRYCLLAYRLFHLACTTYINPGLLFTYSFWGVILCVPLFGDILSAPAWREGHKLLADIQMKYSDIGYQDIMIFDIRISYILMSDDLIPNEIVSIILMIYSISESQVTLASDFLISSN